MNRFKQTYTEEVEVKEEAFINKRGVTVSLRDFGGEYKKLQISNKDTSITFTLYDSYDEILDHLERLL